MGDNVAKMGIDETEKCRETRRRRMRIEMRRLAALAVGKMSQPALVPQQGESSSSMGDKRRDRSELTTGELKRGRGGVVGSCSGGSSSPSTWSSGAVESSSFGHAATAAAAPPPVFGVVSLSGRACDMEDAVTARTDFFHMGDGAAGLNSMHFFAVYDGHGGSHVALLCKERLHVCLAEELGRVVGEHASASASASASAVGSRGAISETEWISAMSRCFQRIDEEALSPCGCEGGVSSAIVGSTAVVAVVEDGRIVVANCGDSRAVLSRGGRAVPLSSDHKPDRPDELARIEASGGRVIYLNGARVQGILAMSRALGDKYLKPIVISEPEVNVMERNPQDEFIILASDGLWDVLSNDLACDIARRCLSDGDPGPEASTVHMTEVGVAKQLDTSTGGRPQFSKCSLAAALLTHLALGRRSSDNISVIVIDLKRTDEGST